MSGGGGGRAAQVDLDPLLQMIKAMHPATSNYNTAFRGTHRTSLWIIGRDVVIGPEEILPHKPQGRNAQLRRINKRRQRRTALSVTLSSGQRKLKQAAYSLQY